LAPLPRSPLSLHDALPIWFLPADVGQPVGVLGQHGHGRVSGLGSPVADVVVDVQVVLAGPGPGVVSSHRASHELAELGWIAEPQDRKSTRLNSSHGSISYA